MKINLKSTVAAAVVCAFAGAALAAPVTASNTTAQPIADNSSITSIINIATGGALFPGSLSFSIGVDHSFIGDLIYTITHGGTSVVLMNRPGTASITDGDSSNLTSTRALNFVNFAPNTAESIGESCGPNDFVGITSTCLNTTFQSHQSLSAFDGTVASGDWFLTISDNENGDVGQLASWSLTYDTGAVSAVPEPEAYAMLLAGLGLIGGIARRRRMQQAKT